MVRGGDPDALDSIVPMAYGNLALDLVLKGVHGRIVAFSKTDDTIIYLSMWLLLQRKSSMFRNITIRKGSDPSIIVLK